MDALRVFVIKLFLKNCNATFTEILESCQKINIFFISHKKFLKIFYKPIFLRQLLTFPLNYFKIHIYLLCHILFRNSSSLFLSFFSFFFFFKEKISAIILISKLQNSWHGK